MAKALVFIHGLGGSSLDTWGRFPELFFEDPELPQYFDIFYFDYESKAIDPLSILGLRTLASIHDMARALRDTINTDCREYDEIVLVCHSMGGLIARCYLIEERKEGRSIERVKQLLLFASPFSGSSLATVGKYISWRNRNLKQLCKNSDLIDLLNHDWFRFEVSQSTEVIYIAGLGDRMVSIRNAAQYWQSKNYHIIEGKDHKSIVKPLNRTDKSFLILKNYLSKLCTNTFYQIPDIKNGKLTQDLSEQLREIGRVIDKLTDEQRSIVSSLIRDINRARPTQDADGRALTGGMIEGCAGSGKTIIAIDMALRLSEYGFSVLLICSSRELCAFIRTFFHKSYVHVFDYKAWRGKYFAGKRDIPDEPYDLGIKGIADLSLSSNDKFRQYDAVIVDEGQDFSKEAWPLIAAAIDPCGLMFLCIFYDEFQRLNNLDGTFPFNLTRYNLGKNCRNAGNIFEIVKKFNADAPIASTPLSGKGYFRQELVAPECVADAAVAVLQELTLKFNVQEIVIVTNEIVGSGHSILSGKSISARPTWAWQQPVCQLLHKVQTELAGDLARYNSFYKELRSVAKFSPREFSDSSDFARELQRLRRGSGEES